MHGTGNIPADYHDLTEPGFTEASRWLQRCAKLFNKDRLTENRYWLLRNILGAHCTFVPALIYTYCGSVVSLSLRSDPAFVPTCKTPAIR